MTKTWLTTENGTGTPSVLRRLNEARVLRVIRDQGPMPRSAIVKESGISKPTVNEVVETLLAEGLIVESLDGGSSSPRRPGPRARLLRFNSRRWLVVGVDVEASRILALLSDLDGTILSVARRATPGGVRADDILRGVRQCIRDAVSQVETGWEAVGVVVVGTPGIVDPDTGTVRLAPQLPGWEGRPLARLLHQSLSHPVLVEHDAHLAVTGEYWRGVASGSRSVTYIQIDVGVGMGILIDGAIYAGVAGAAGEIGFLPVASSSGDRAAGLGPFEAAIGATAFVRLAQEAIAAGKGAGIADAAGKGEVTPAAVLQAARSGDAAALAIVDGIIAQLTQGLVSVAALLNPEVIVLGGEIGSLLGDYVIGLERSLVAAVPAPPRVLVTSLEDQAIAVGAVRRGIEYVEAQVFDELGVGTR